MVLSLAFVGGCANPYSQFYVDLTGSQNVLGNQDIIMPTDEPTLIQGYNIETDGRRMLEDGYSLLGFSSFNGGEINQNTALEHAKKIHAEKVIVYSAYTNTISGMMPMTLPDTQTSYHSGSIYGSGGGFANYSGTSTTYGSRTTYMPYSISRYDYYASFWGRHKPSGGLGIYFDDLTDELRKDIGSNKGIRIVVVVKGSTAFNNDILVDDIIYKFNDIDVIDKVHFLNIIKENREQQIKLEIFRGGKSITKLIQLN
jgi:hypothetical protein